MLRTPIVAIVALLVPSLVHAQAAPAPAPITDLQLEQQRSAMYATQVQYLGSIVDRLQAQIAQKDSDWAKYSESLWKPYQTSQAK